MDAGLQLQRLQKERQLETPGLCLFLDTLKEAIMKGIKLVRPFSTEMSTFSPLWGFGIIIALTARVTTLVLTLPVLVHQLLGLGTARTQCDSRGRLRVQCLGLFATLMHYLLWYLLYCAIMFTIIHCGQCTRIHDSLLPQLLGHAGAGRRRRKGGDWDFTWALYMLFNTKTKT